MKSISLSPAALLVLAIALIGAGSAAGYWFAGHSHRQNNALTQKNAADKKILYWYDPMMPNQHFDKPGKSPFMDMQLVPKYAGDNAGADNGIEISPALRQNLGIRMALVEQRALGGVVAAFGTIGFNERELAIVQARSGGFVGRVYARAPGDVIARGAPLVDIAVPEWMAAQQEYLTLRRGGDSVLSAAARDRLRSLGMPDDLIQRVERDDKPRTTVTVTAPIGGVITALDVRSGMTVSMGATLAQINSLDSVWLSTAIPQALAADISVGDAIEAQLPALADDKRSGHVIAILPQTDAANLTQILRIELANPRGELRPGQYARVRVRGHDSAPVVAAPSAALIRSGARTVAIVAHGDRFQPVQVETGREVDGITEILSGLQAGQQVVVSGQFLIDSEANLSGALQQMAPDKHLEHDHSAHGGEQ